MSLFYIFAASGIEAQPVRKMSVASNGNSLLRCGRNEVALITGAMGPKNARNKADAVLSGGGISAFRKPEAVLSIGLCGGLSLSLPGQRIVAYTECLSTQTGNKRACSQEIVDATVAVLASSNIRCDRVVGITSPRIATTPAEKLNLGRHGASVVDMESYSILDAATRAGVPGAVIRVVSDSVEWELPDFNRALNEDGGLDGWKALRVALGSPLRTLRLLSANRRAMQSLAKALEVILKADSLSYAMR